MPEYCCCSKLMINKKMTPVQCIIQSYLPAPVRSGVRRRLGNAPVRSRGGVHRRPPRRASRSRPPFHVFILIMAEAAAGPISTLCSGDNSLYASYALGHLLHTILFNVELRPTYYLKNM